MARTGPTGMPTMVEFQLVAKARVAIDFYSDLLCVWAYLAHVKLDELRKSFADRVTIEHRCVSVFGSTRRRIGDRWAERGGYAGYARHVREVVEQFGHVEVHPDVWTKNVPSGSCGPHLFFKAVALLEPEGTIDGRPVLEELAWRLRRSRLRCRSCCSRLWPEPRSPRSRSSSASSSPNSACC